MAAPQPAAPDNSFLRNSETGDIYQVLGGARYLLSPAEYASLGSPAFTNVSASVIRSVTGARPVGSYFLRDPLDGGIYQAVGGAKYRLSATDFTEVGSPAWIGAPLGFINTLGAVPQDHTYLRSLSDHTIYEILNGTKRFLTFTEWKVRHEPPYTNVPDGFLNTVPTA